MERGGAPEVLLLQSKLLSSFHVVVRVQNSRDGFGSLLIGNCALILTRVEFGEVELARRSSARPQAQVVHRSSSVSWNGHIVRYGCDDLAILPRCDLLAVLIRVFVDPAVELDVNCDIVSRELPRVEVKPVVRNLDLVSVVNLLLENTVSVS